MLGLIESLFGCIHKGPTMIWAFNPPRLGFYFLQGGAGVFRPLFRFFIGCFQEIIQPRRRVIALNRGIEACTLRVLSVCERCRHTWKTGKIIICSQRWWVNPSFGQELSGTMLSSTGLIRGCRWGKYEWAFSNSEMYRIGIFLHQALVRHLPPWLAKVLKRTSVFLRSFESDWKPFKISRVPVLSQSV